MPPSVGNVEVLSFTMTGPREAAMLYVGLDLHTKQITACVLNSNGKIHDRWQVRQLDQLFDRLARFEQPFEVVYEASSGYGYIFEQLSKLAARVLVAHPGLLKMIFRSKRKNDRN